MARCCRATTLAVAGLLAGCIPSPQVTVDVSAFPGVSETALPIPVATVTLPPSIQPVPASPAVPAPWRVVFSQFGSSESQNLWASIVGRYPIHARVEGPDRTNAIASVHWQFRTRLGQVQESDTTFPDVAWDFQPKQDDEDSMTVSALVHFRDENRPPTTLTATVPVMVLSNKTVGRSSLTGMIYDSVGNPVTGASVTAVVLDPYWRLANGSDALTVAAPQGAYAVHGVPNGAPIRLTASQPDYDSQEQTVTLTGNIIEAYQAWNFGQAGVVDHPTALRRRP